MPKITDPPVLVETIHGKKIKKKKKKKK